MRKILDIIVTFAILGSIAILVAWMGNNLENEYVGRVFVIDGDSLRMGEHEIRLEGIDAPELDQTCTIGAQNYDCGKQSRQQLLSLVKGKNTKCKAWKRDKYQRQLGRCFVDELDINAQMVKMGWALAYGDYYSEEKNATKEKLGVWRGNFIRPREWRLLKVQ